VQKLKSGIAYSDACRVSRTMTVVFMNRQAKVGCELAQGRD
jgi:hypothetical protein